MVKATDMFFKMLLQALTRRIGEKTKTKDLIWSLKLVNIKK